MRGHWWWRPGWRPGRRMYTWHVTFGDQPAVQVQLILLGRDEHRYQWETQATVRLGAPGR